MNTPPDVEAIRARLRAAGWVPTDSWERYVGRRWSHEVVIARAGQVVRGRGPTLAEAWADAERQAIGEG